MNGLPTRGTGAHRPAGERQRVLWSWRPRTDREAADAINANLLLHGLAPSVSADSLAWRYSAWLGTATAALFALLLLSGLPLMALYVPSVERAYQSVKDIEYVVTFGWWIRAVHRIAAHGMIVAAVLHLGRVFLTGAYKNGIGIGQRREWNWAIGAVMLLVTLLLSFTGYLLPWDQLAFWAVTVGTSIVSAIPGIGSALREVIIGGRAIDQATLVRFYALHVVVLPGALVVLLGYHMWRVRKDGGLARADLAVARAGAGAALSPVPVLTRRAFAVALGTLALVSILGAAIRSPLEGPASALITPNPARAPWFFLWLQELVADTTLRLGSFTINGALVGGILLPGLLTGLLVFWPWLDRAPASTTGQWFPESRRRQCLVFIVIVLFVLGLTLVAAFMRGPSWHFYWPWDIRPAAPVRI